MKERDFQAQVIQLAKWLGWKTAHFRAAQTQRGRWITPLQGDAKGFPDLVLLHEGQKRAIFAELKSDKGVVASEQLNWLETAKACGIETYLWRPKDYNRVETILRRGICVGDDREKS